MVLKAVCPIWKTPATDIGMLPGAYSGIDSPRTGGEYAIELVVQQGIGNISDPLKVRLTSWLINQRKRGVLLPVITMQLMEAAVGWGDMDMSMRVDNLLRYLDKNSNGLGDSISFRRPIWKLFPSSVPDEHEIRSWEMYAHSGCLHHKEFEVLLTYLQDRSFITYFPGDVSTCALSVPGYTHLDELRKAVPDSPTVFVAMWFDPSMNEAYEKGIKPAIEQAGYEPVRIDIDRGDHLGKIDDQIIGELRRARFVVADFTRDKEGSRGSVYYEAGFAHGLGLDVLFTCHEDWIRKADFDTRQYSHIVWKEPEDLQKSVREKILANFGMGPLSPAQETYSP